MGTWSTAIDGNDTFQDIYQNFFNLYNQGHNPVDISKKIREDFSPMFNDVDDRNNSFFGLALAQWETNSLEPNVFQTVKQIIESGDDLKFWEGSYTDDKTIKKRQTALHNFLKQISQERDKPKRRVKPKFEFKTADIIKILAPDNKKTFHIFESYTNNKYVHTVGGVDWTSGGGGSVLYFTAQNIFITAKWLDSKTLEITHARNILFEKKDDSAYFNGDSVKIEYKTA